MSYNPYELNVISKHSNFQNKSLKKYNIAGLDYVGVWGDEPFEIVFKNNTWQKIQVKLSIDGTDILTGKKADTQAHGDMWVVHGGATITLKAWPETSKGGAQFIFTSAEKSVAVNTHGDVSSRGIIAAAVYTEGYTPPVRLERFIQCGGMGGFNYGTGNDFKGGWSGDHIVLGDQDYFNTESINISGSLDVECNDSRTLSENTTFSSSITPSGRKSKPVELKSLASVGAGQQVQQDIEHVAGLTKPVLGPIVRVRYEWWDELRQKLESNNVQSGTGFPGNMIQKIMSIGSTPRQHVHDQCFCEPEEVARPNFTRF